MPDDNTPRLDALEARMNKVEETVATLIDPDDVRDDNNISPAMYRAHEAVAQALVDSGHPDHPDIETARRNLDNLLAGQP